MYFFRSLYNEPCNRSKDATCARRLRNLQCRDLSSPPLHAARPQKSPALDGPGFV